MNRTAIVFVASPRLDTYINVIAHAHSSKRVDAINLVSILGGSMSSTKAELAAVGRDVFDEVDSLAAGSYRGKPLAYNTPRTQTYVSIMGNLSSVSHNFISYDDVPNVLKQIIREAKGDIFVDVTSLPKPIAIEVTALCLGIGVPVYTFTLCSASADDPERSLWHALEEGDASYVCLTNSELVSSSRLIRQQAITRWAAGSAVVCFVCLSLCSARRPEQ